MSGKNPAFQFYPNDWMRDLEEHPLEIEGAWIRLCCKLWWSETRGKLTKTIPQWAKILRESEDKTTEILGYIEKEKIGNVFNGGNGYVTVMSRRIVNDEKERKLNRLRVARHREKHGSNGGVTAMSHRSSSSSSTSVPKNCPQKQIVDLWHSLLPELPKVKEWDETRQSLLRARWNENQERQSIDWWSDFFGYIRKCPFLMGDVDPSPGRQRFIAKLPWVLKKANFLKILEGNYE